MKARLVQLTDGRRVASTTLGDTALTIGRDPDCEIVVLALPVSRRHARVERLGGLHTLVDLGSANGTTIGGRRVEGRVALEPGCEFELAGEVRFRYEVSRDVPWLAAGAAVALAVGVVAGLLLLSVRDPVWLEAKRLAAEAVEADGRGDYAVARQRLSSAVRLLLRKRKLDEVPRTEVVEVAMARLGERLGGQTDLEELFERAHRRTALPPSSDADECRLDEVAIDRFDPCLRQRVEATMLALRQDPSLVPEHFYADVGRRLARERAFLASALPRGGQYREMMTEELARSYMPPLLHYLACIESGYRSGARSPAGAMGLWQFMPGTARDYGLRVGTQRDDRTDPRRSTRAAAQYLRALAFEFGGESLMLVLASYNRGENAVRRALKRLDDPYSDRSYWALVEAGYLPDETAEYVTRFVAAAVAGEAGLPSEPLLRAAGY